MFSSSSEFQKVSIPYTPLRTKILDIKQNTLGICSKHKFEKAQHIQPFAPFREKNVQIITHAVTLPTCVRRSTTILITDQFLGFLY